MKNRNSDVVRMLTSALWVKDRIFDETINDVQQKSPKYCALHELSEYLDLKITSVEKWMLVEEPVHEEWKKMKVDPYDHDDINHFYRVTDSYVYELMAANNIVQTLYAYSVMIERLQKLGVRNILDYGGGAGTLSILLSRLGYKVTYADLAGKTADFAGWRFKKRGLNIPIINLEGNEKTDLKAPNLKNARFDCILSAEVIEHVLYPVDLIKSFKNKLPSGGIAVISESCQYTEQFISHLESNKKYGGLEFIRIMRTQGFEQLPVDFFIPQQLFIKL